MGKYVLRRLIIAIPSLLGISLVLFVLLALAPGDPFGELATNSNIPPEVRAALRVKFGIDDRILAADILHRVAADFDLQRQSRLAAVRLSRRYISHRLGLVLGTVPAGHH